MEIINVDKILEDVKKLQDDFNDLENKNKKLTNKVDYLMEAHKYSLSKIIMAIFKKNKN